MTTRDELAKLIYESDLKHAELEGESDWDTEPDGLRANYYANADAVLASSVIAQAKADALRDAAAAWDRVHEDPEAVAYIERECSPGGSSAPSIWLRWRVEQNAARFTREEPSR